MGSGFQHRRPADPAADEPAAATLRPSLSRPPGLKPVGTLRRCGRYLRLGLHLLAGLLIVLSVFPFARLATRRRLRQNWSRRLLGHLGIRLQPSPGHIQPGTMLVANHVSWIDIFVINALAPAAFVSKAEVRRWPAIGWLAARNDTLFLQRGSRAHARLISNQIAALLDNEGTVALFPEGTTSDGRQVLHFHAALLQAPIDAGRPVQPLALRYRTPDGEYCAAPTYEGDTSLLECLSNIIAQPIIIADVVLMDAVQPPADSDRRQLANSLRERIARQVAPEPPAGKAPGSDSAHFADSGGCAQASS